MGIFFINSYNGLKVILSPIILSILIILSGCGGSSGSDPTVTDDTTIIEDPSAPAITVNTKNITINKGESHTITWSTTETNQCYIDNEIGYVEKSGSIVVTPVNTTIYTISAFGILGNADEQITVKVRGNPSAQPEGSYGKNYEDLNPVDSTVDSYDPKRYAVITGFVNNIQGSPLKDVSVTIFNHPEYGTAMTDASGRFSLPVDGGNAVTVSYSKEGFISAERQVETKWNDIAIVETVQLIEEDNAYTDIQLDGNSGTITTHQSNNVTDSFGSRSLTMVFSGDNVAYSVDKDGGIIKELNAFRVRATEFKTYESMPAQLPPNSAYTYCVELKVDGVKRVQFDKPVTLFIDNFLGFDVGDIIPVGFYNRDKGIWEPADNGYVVKLLDQDFDGIVDALDIDGDDLPDDLNSNGFFNDEVAGLDDPAKYIPDMTYWKVTTMHFSIPDCNLPWGPPLGGAPGPRGFPPFLIGAKPEPCKRKTNSYIEERSQIFNEDIPIPGTGIKLHYKSSRANGYMHKIIISASGSSVPANLKRINVNLRVAGRSIAQIYNPISGQKAILKWDGKDYRGRDVRSHNATVSIGFVYDAYYYKARRDVVQAFAQQGVETTLIPARQEITTWQRNKIVLSRGDGEIADGWTLTPHHHMKSSDKTTLHKGDGSLLKNTSRIINTFAGSDISSYTGDGGPAIEAGLNGPNNIAVDAAGNIFIADLYHHCIRKIDSEGIITTIAGQGTVGSGGDGGPAVDAYLSWPSDIAIDTAGNIYIADRNNHRIRKIDNNGIITTIAGTGTGGDSGDNGPAVEAQLDRPYGVAVDYQGNVYIADTYNYRIRKIDTNGIITTIAGNGSMGTSGIDGPAIDAQIGYAYDVEIDAEGNVFFSSSFHRIRKVDVSGILLNYAGSGSVGGSSGDGGPAVDARLNSPRGICLDSTGNLYISDYYNHKIRMIDVSGKINTVAGNGNGGFGGDGGAAISAELNYPIGVGIDKEGSLLIADNQNDRLRKVSHPTAVSGQISSDEVLFGENGIGYILTVDGRHKSTIDLDTGIIMKNFNYDTNNKLISISDQFNNVIEIERNLAGIPVAVISPEGIRTELSIDSNNQLTGITYPDGNIYGFEYDSGGFMTAEIEPKGNRYEHVYDEDGRLTDAYNQEGGHWNYSRTLENENDVRTEITTGEGNLTTYLDYTETTGEYSSTITDPTGSETLFQQSFDGLNITKTLPCGMSSIFNYQYDERDGTKYLSGIVENTPSNLQRNTTMTRSYEDTDADGIIDLVTREVTLNGNTSTSLHNTLLSQRTITTAEGRIVTELYYPIILLTTSVSRPGLLDIIYQYDEKGRTTSISRGTRESLFIYDTNGNLESITDPEDNITSFAYDDSGRPVTITRPDLTTVNFTYDGNGNMTVLRNPFNIDHSYGFDLINSIVSYNTPLSGEYRYEYDNDKRLLKKTFPSGRELINVYDTINLSQIQTPEGNINYSYLCSSKIGTITKGTESIEYGYDGKLLTSVTTAGTLNSTVLYTYNSDYNISGLTYAGLTDNITYDTDRLITGSGSFSVTRDTGNGMPLSVSDGNYNLTRTFNGYGEIESRSEVVNSISISSSSLTRDNNGRIVGRSETIDGTTSSYIYTYDSLGHLLTVTKDSILIEEYQYNNNGSRVYEMNISKGFPSGRTFSYSNEDHMVSAGSVVYEYDADGFLSRKTDGADITIYTYSSRGELLNVSLPGGTSIEYLHDPVGRRIAKKVDGTTIEKYLWQGRTRLLAVYDGSDNLLMRFNYGDARMPVSMTQGGSVYYLIYDQAGSLRAVTDSSGNIVKKIDYDSFGSIITDSNSSFNVPFRFAGGLYDSDTKLIRFGYRDYNADPGRWTAKDPIGFDGGDTDLYGYVLNDPINNVDPSGQFILAGLYLAACNPYIQLVAASAFTWVLKRAYDVDTGDLDSSSLQDWLIGKAVDTSLDGLNAILHELLNEENENTDPMESLMDVETPSDIGFDSDTPGANACAL